MSALKYKNGNSWERIDSIVVNSNNVLQQSGTSLSDVMSQSAVTKALSDVIETIPSKDEYATKSYVDNLFNSMPLENAGATAIIYKTCAMIFGEQTPTLANYYGDNDSLQQVLSHFKIGVFDGNGNLVSECAPGRLTSSKGGTNIAIDGSMGDVMLYVDEDIYRDRASLKGLSVSGSTGTTATTYNILGLGLRSHSVGGLNAKKIEPFAITPHYTVYVKLDGENEVQQHSIYNENVSGTYNAPIQLFTSQYAPNGNKFPTCAVSSLSSSLYARNKGGGYMGLYYEFYEIWMMAMYLELGTLDFTSTTLFGNGCTKYAPTSSDWFTNDVPGNSGIRIKHSGGDLFDPLFNSVYGINGNTGTTSNNSGLFSNSYPFNFTECLEAQRIMDGITKAELNTSIGGTVLMTYDSEGNVITASSNVDVSTGDNMEDNKKYFTVRNVGSCKGLADGVMTGVVNIYMKKTFAANVMRSNTNVGGDVAIWKFSHPIYRGLDLFSGMFTHLEGMYWVMNAEGDASNDGTEAACTSQDFYYAESWDKVPTSISTSNEWIVSSISSIPKILSGLTKGLTVSGAPYGWSKSTDYNQSLYAHTDFGAAQHTYECGYIWKGGTVYGAPNSLNNYPIHGYKYANASVAGCPATAAVAGRPLAASTSVAYSYSNSAGGFAHPQITV